MRYTDAIYGDVEIEEPVLIDLMQTQAMQRLRGILQHGITALIGITQPVTRFDHSLGVMLLVRRLHARASTALHSASPSAPPLHSSGQGVQSTPLGQQACGSLEEQIAALLHDVSHTAFSHVIDYAVDGHDRQSYHEEQKEPYLLASDVPAILARHGYDWRDFLHEEDYPLLEQPAPRLCADRLDYFLRDSRDLGLSTWEDIQHVLDHLVVREGRIGVDDIETAQWMAYTFIAADKASWANFREVGLYEVTARAIKTALRLGALTEEDFWGTDEQLWRKLHAIGDADAKQQLALISPATRFEWNEAHPTFRISTKLRTIDPDILLDGRFQPLSTLDTDFARYRADYLNRNQGQWPMRVVA